MDETTVSASPAADSAPLDDESASTAFASILADEPKKDDKPAAPEAPAADPAPEPAQGEDNAQAEGDDAQPGPITVMVDGKPVQLTSEQIADAYKNGLKEKDYRQKTMALSEERRAAKEAAARAEAERTQYATNLQMGMQQLQALTQIQQQTDWDALREQDPMEYLRQRDLLEKRQTALAAGHQRLAALHAQHTAHEQQQRAEYVEGQRETMLAKIPAWKDAAKARAEMTQLNEYLRGEGYSEQEINNVIDHKPVVMARKAMLYDQLMAKAATANKRVVNLPSRTERPGSTDSRPIDGRSAVYQSLRKTGSDDAAAALFSSLLR